jgi:hypothetical protein
MTTTHGHAKCRTTGKSPEYRCWGHILDRCYRPKTGGYERYGGRGIKVCDRWRHSFENFLADMGTKPSKDHSIDRIDVNGDYEPGNCRWATRAEQDLNRRNTLFVTAMGETLPLKVWSERTGIPYDAMWSRIKSGWDEERAVTAPIVYGGEWARKRAPNE